MDHFVLDGKVRMWSWRTALENAIEEDRGQELDEKGNDNPVRLVGEADAVDEDLGRDEKKGDEQLILEIEEPKFCAQQGGTEVFFAPDLVSSDGEEQSKKRYSKGEPHVVREGNNK